MRQMKSKKHIGIYYIQALVHVTSLLFLDGRNETVLTSTSLLLNQSIESKPSSPR